MKVYQKNNYLYIKDWYSIKNFVVENIDNYEFLNQTKELKILMTEENVAKLNNILILPLFKKENIEINLESNLDKSSIPVKIEPFKHQVDAFNLAIDLFNKNHSGFALFAEMGCGKTLTTIGILGYLYNKLKLNKVLIVCPKSLIYTWKQELEKYANYDVNITLISNYKKQGIALETGKMNILIMNYENTWRYEKPLLKTKFDFIVADESHKIKTFNSKQSKTMHKLGDLATFKIILTGTPITNTPIDIWSQYRFLDKSVFGSSFYSFKTKYVVMNPYSYEILHYNNLNELKERMHNIAYRITKEQALDLPEFTDENRFLCLDDKTKKIYKDMLRDAFVELDHDEEVTVQNVLTKLLRLQQITSGFIKNDSGSIEEINNQKISELEYMLTTELINKKVVVFARFTKEINDIQNLCKKLDIKYSLIDGSVNSTNRMEAIHNFQNDEDYRIFIGQIQSCSTGITLTASDTMIFYSLDFNYSNYSQAKARIHRIGQKNKCTYIHFIAKDTIDEDTISALNNKENIANNIVNNYKAKR